MLDFRVRRRDLRGEETESFSLQEKRMHPESLTERIALTWLCGEGKKGLAFRVLPLLPVEKSLVWLCLKGRRRETGRSRGGFSDMMKWMRRSFVVCKTMQCVSLAWNVESSCTVNYISSLPFLAMPCQAGLKSTWNSDWDSLNWMPTNCTEWDNYLIHNITMSCLFELR